MCRASGIKRDFLVIYRDFSCACSTHDVRSTTRKSSTCVALGTCLPAAEVQHTSEKHANQSQDARHDVLIRQFPLALLKESNQL